MMMLTKKPFLRSSNHLVEQLGAEAEEGDGDHTEHRHDDRQRELHAIALSGMVNGHH